MQTRFEQFALTSMLGSGDSPPRLNGKLCFGQEWERQAFGVALALSRTGRFDWEDFRQELIKAIGEWENSHSLEDPSWSYYERWLTALERLLIEAQLMTAEDLSRHEDMSTQEDLSMPMDEQEETIGKHVVVAGP